MAGNAFRITGPLWGESTGHLCIPLQARKLSLDAQFIIDLPRS